MRFRGAIQRTTSTNARSTAAGSETERRRLERLARLAILGFGFAIVADAVIRHLESLGPTAAVDDVRKHRGGSVPHDQTRTGTDESDTETTPASGRDADDQPIDDDETSVDLTDGERAEDEIEERVEPDVQDEPATPGEMSIDEGVADEMRDDGA